MRALAALVATLLACANTGYAQEQTDTQTIPAVKAIGELPPPPPHQWADATIDLNDNRTAGNGIVAAPALSKYLNQLYAAIKASAGTPDWPGVVYISSDTTLNAHASASGNIYLNLGLIQSVETEDEIYAVLAHEFAHIYLNHQAAYESHQVASNIATGTKAVLLGFFKKKVPAATASWGAFDSLSLVESVVHDSLLPVWQRDVEEQADMFAATLSMRDKYSYPAGFKAFLERLATVERRVQENQAVAPAANPFATPTTTTADPAANAAAGQTVRKSHATAREREEVLTAKMLPLMPRPRPVARKAQWQAVQREKETAELLSHFALLPQIAQLQAAGRHGDAVKMANIAASGVTAGDATLLLVLQEAMRRSGASIDDQRKVLLRNRNWTERAWSVLYQAAALVTPDQSAFAKEFLQEQYTYFGEAPRMWPDMIAFYTKTGDNFLKAGLSLKCLTEARFRDACADRGLTEAERQQLAAQQAARQKGMLDRLDQKIQEKLKVKQ